MIKRMVIMLIAVVVVLGGIFGFEVFKAVMIKKFMAAHELPPQTVSRPRPARGMAAADRGGRQPARRQRRRSVARGRRRRRSISFNSGDDVRAGRAAAQAARGRRHRQAQSLQATAELTRSPTSATSKQFKTQAVSQATVDTDAANLKNAKAQVAQQQAIVDKKILRAPVRRPSRHPRGRSRPISRRRHGHRHAAGARPDLSSISSCRSNRSTRSRSARRSRCKIDTFPDQTFAGEISAINPKVDTSDPQRPGARDVEKSGSQAAARHVRDRGHRRPARRRTTSRCRRPRSPINPYGNTVYLVDDKGKDASGKPQLVARQTFVTTGATRGDQVADPQGRQRRRHVVTAGQIKLHNGSTVQINNSITADRRCRPDAASISRRAAMNFTDIFIRRPVLATSSA